MEIANKSAEEVEVFSTSRKTTEAIFEANRLKLIQTKESQGTALRLIKNGRIGFSATNKPNGKQELLSMALEMAPFGAEAKFEFPGLYTYPEVAIFDPAVESISEEAMVQFGQSLIDGIRAKSPEIVCEATVSRTISSIQLRNSRGAIANYRRSVFSIGIEGVIIRGTDMLFVGDYESSCHPISTPDHVAQSTLEQLERAENTALSLTGTLPVIFTPHGVAASLIAPLATAFNGKTVLRGASLLGTRKGEQVLDPAVSIRDDATISFCPASSICDDEGIPSQQTSLVEKGVIANFLYDLQTAAEAGTASTGNARRLGGSLPNPSTNALIISEGKVSFADMLADIKEGLVIEQLMGATQGNILGGDFSGNVLLGYRVTNGRIVGRVKNTMVSGNVYEALKENVIIGSDSRWLGGSLKTPSILCPRIAVTATD